MNKTTVEEALKLGNITLAYDPKTDTLKLYIDDEEKAKAGFGNNVDELFHRALCLWGKKYTGKDYDF